MTDLAGTKLAGRYLIESLIGRGGMADVYRGTDTMLERPIAIKILTDRSDTILRRFLREAQSMARLNHRNIVSVYDAGQVDGLSYIVMEFIEGRSLAQIPGAELTMHVAVRYCIDLLEALMYAHDQSIIHRDIKPANIMVAQDGTVKVMDFGLSRRTSEMSSETNAGEIVGTIAYLAPERFLGKVADARSDLYSVGVVMYEIFTGRVPFKSATDDLVAVIFAHVNDIPPALRTINRAVPPQVDRIVLKLLDKNVDLRYQTARELSAELQALIGGPSVSTSPATQSVRPAELPAGPDSAARGSGPAEANDTIRNALDRSFRVSSGSERSVGNVAGLNAGFSSALAGMLAARKRDYPEAIRYYQEALRVFTELGNELEHSKAALKYAAMILDKNTEMQHPNRREVDEATKLVTTALAGFRSRRMLKEFEEGERVAHALQRIGLRLR